MIPAVLSRFKGSAEVKYFLITEVTRMSAGMVCIAALDLNDFRTVRLLRWNHSNWTGQAFPQVVPGAIVAQRIANNQFSSGFPHESEDLQCRDDVNVVHQLSHQEFYDCLINVVDPSIPSIFGGSLRESKYVEADTVCRSLGSVKMPSRQVEFSAPYGKLRCVCRLGGVLFDLPVTDLALLRLYEEHGLQALATLAARKPGSDLVMRVGLARAWDGGSANDYNPKRCYLQVNGLVFPP